jgi:transposase
MGHLLGYACVSTTDQQPQLQVDALQRAGCYRVFTETASGARADRPGLESLGVIEAAALAGAPAGTRLEVVVEPTGPAWLPVAVFFSRRGHTVYRVSSAKSADLRRFLSRHAKSNAIDAETSARLPLVDP